MGDVVLTTALIRCIRNTYPDATIDFVVAQPYAELLRHNIHIDHVYVYDKSNDETNKELHSSLSKDYNIIDLQNNFRSIEFRSKLGKVVATMPHRRFQKLALVWFKFNLFDGRNIADIYIDTAKKLGITNDTNGLEIWLPEEKEHRNYAPNSRVNNIDKPICFAIAPGAKHKTKQWSANNFAKLIHAINENREAEFHILGGEEDCSESEIITSECMDLQVYDHCGQTSLLDTVRILDKCDMLISNDTGVMHLGAARHLPIIALFGSTVPAFGFTPYRTEYKICEVQLKCRPCSHIGKDSCKYGHFNCMKLLTPEAVLAKIIE
jgi:heptosyltransferase-2